MLGQKNLSAALTPQVRDPQVPFPSALLSLTLVSGTTENLNQMRTQSSLYSFRFFCAESSFRSVTVYNSSSSCSISSANFSNRGKASRVQEVYCCAATKVNGQTSRRPRC